MYENFLVMIGVYESYLGKDYLYGFLIALVLIGICLMWQRYTRWLALPRPISEYGNKIINLLANQSDWSEGCDRFEIKHNSKPVAIKIDEYSTSIYIDGNRINRLLGPYDLAPIQKAAKAIRTALRLEANTNHERYLQEKLKSL